MPSRPAWYTLGPSESMLSALNPFVEYLNALRTQEGDANPDYVEENRSRHLKDLRRSAPWFPEEESLRVRTKIATLVSELAAGTVEVDLLFLTGDAGDGKTAACVDFAHAVGHHGPLARTDSVGDWTMIKDASEHPEETVASLVRSALAGERRLVVAINEGRLRRLFKAEDLGDTWREVVEPALRGWTEANDADALDTAMRSRRVGVVNFRHRMHVDAVAPALLEQWTRPEQWEGSPACVACPAQARCPMLANARSVRVPEVALRVTEVLTMAHYAGQRLPFRRLQGVLAWCVTGGHSCTEIIAAAEPALDDRYYSLLFATRPRGTARPEPIARSLSAADPYLTANPAADAQISAVLGNPESLTAFEQAALRTTKAAKSDIVRTLRRREMFESALPARTTWRDGLRLLSRYALTGDEAPLRNAVTRAINILHRHPTTLEGFLPAEQLEPASFRDPARSSLELSLGTRFATRLVRGPVLPRLVDGWLESCPSEIELQAWPENGTPVDPARLHLDARLVTLLLEVGEGFAFVPALGSYRRELARFHSRLVAMVPAPNIALSLRSDHRVWRLGEENGRITLNRS